MHFHLPKPLHGWREFSGEVGIIVIGIMIALGGDQVVEHFRHKNDLREAEEAMVMELRDDDLPQAYTRAAVYNCYADQIDAMEAAVKAGDRDKFVALEKDYRPVFRTWDDEAWKSALASQVLVNAGTKRMIGWSTAYIAIPLLSNAANAETDELPHLHAALSGTGRLSTVQQDRLFDVLSLLRHQNNGMNGDSLVFMRFLGNIGIDLTPHRKDELLAEARTKLGNCVSKPAPERINMTTQVSTGTDAELGRHQ